MPTRSLAVVCFTLLVLLGAACSVSRIKPVDGDVAIRSHAPGVVGDLRLHAFASKAFGNTRTLRVLVPDGYDSAANRNRRYGVLYMADGQNVFDSATSVFGPSEWKLDEAVHQLVGAGTIPPMIVVGVDDAGRNARDHEYLPYPDSETARINPSYDPHPEGKRYPRFLVDEVMPFIDAHYRTLKDAEHTGIGGSSYGAVISLYTATARPGVFGRLLLESAVLRISDYQLLRDAAAVRTWPGRVYLAVGTNEDSRPGCVVGPPPTIADTGRIHDDMVLGTLRLQALLGRAGLDTSRLLSIVVPCATHTHRAWAARLPDALTFLFAERQ